MMHGSAAAACFFSPTPISFLLASQTDFEKLQSTYQAHQHINVGICNRWRGGWRYHFYLRSRSSAPSKKKKLHKIAAAKANSPTARFRIKENSINSGYNVMIGGKYSTFGKKIYYIPNWFLFVCYCSYLYQSTVLIITKISKPVWNVVSHIWDACLKLIITQSS